MVHDVILSDVTPVCDMMVIVYTPLLNVKWETRLVTSVGSSYPNGSYAPRPCPVFHCLQYQMVCKPIC